MKGSNDSQPPKFTPLAGSVSYDPHGLLIAGVFEFADLESSQVEKRPISGRSPTVSFVYVVLKSLVSYHENGSRYVPFAALGTESCETPFRFAFVGLPD